MFHEFLFPFKTTSFSRIGVISYHQAKLFCLAHGFKHIKAISICWIKLHWHKRKSWTQSRQKRVDLVTFFSLLIMCEVITDITSIRSDYQLGSCWSDAWQGRREQSWLAHIGLQPVTSASLKGWFNQLNSPSHMAIFTLGRRNSTMRCFCFCAITINRPFLPTVKNFPICFFTLLANNKS